jgi:glutamyl-tRNA synthetase
VAERGGLLSRCRGLPLPRVRIPPSPLKRGDEVVLAIGDFAQAHRPYVFINAYEDRSLNKVRVRFAPSPTGFVHIGGLRTALYNFLFARKYNGTFILRIEDTDRERFVEGATENLISVLEWAGLLPDEGPKQGGVAGPYFQSERTQIYQQHVRQLVDRGVAYYAFDTASELEAMRQAGKQSGDYFAKYSAANRMQMRNSLTMSQAQVEEALTSGQPYVIRLLVPEGRKFEVNDVVRGQVIFDSREVDDQVLLKSDGFPTYHLANVVDDHLMEVSHVIRGEEWLSSVPKHLLLYEYFGWQPPVMAHLPLIFNPDGSKMSKRDIKSLDELPSGKVDPDVASYIKRGYEKAAILNYIALLGWNPGEGDDRQVFTLQELVSEFSLERVNKSAAIFDIKKLNWLNKEHIMMRTPKDLAQENQAHVAEITAVDQDYLIQVVALLKERLYFSRDVLKIGSYFFQDPQEYEMAAVRKRWDEDSTKIIVEFCAEIAKLELFKAAEIEQILRNVAEQNQVGAGKLIHPVRLAVTGVSVGPGLFELLQVLGKETVVRRLQYAAEAIPKLI